MRLALVHDFLVQHGGAEEVLRAFHETWPDAPIYTLIHDPERAGTMVKGATVHPSFLQSIPFARRRYQWLLPLMPSAVERHDLSAYDVVLSSSSAFAKGVITHPHTLHVCYCHTPTRYLWSDTHTYVNERRSIPPLQSLAPFLLSYLRLWDRHSADRVDHFIANSSNVQRRIAKYYRKESDVLHPPVDTARFTPNTQYQIPNTQGYFLTGGRLVGYKRFDLVVRVFNRLGTPLKIFGTGPALAELRAAAKPNIEFCGFVDATTRADLYRNCVAFIHPQEEDFGISAIEAMASGRPVIAYARGGVLETMIDGVTGVFFDEQIWEALADAILRFDARSFDAEKIRTHALQWDVSQFKTRIKEYVDDKWKQFQDSKS